MTGQNKQPGRTASLSDATFSSQKEPSSFNPGQAGPALRQQAEKIALERMTKSPQELTALSPEEIQQVFYELQVHQIELEMQNEELQRTQDELEVVMARYFDLYDLAPVGYCTISDAGLILEANLTAANLLGVPRGGLIRKPLSRFILKEDQDSYYLLRKKILEACSAHRQDSEQQSELQDCDLRMVTNDGAVFWVHLQVTIMEDAGHSLVYRMVLSDISERKQAEAQRLKLEDQERQLQKAESLERMAGAIAHLFNNQLCVVLGNLEMTLYDMAEDTLPRQNLEDAMRAARRSAEISGLLLTYLGQGNSNSEPMDLSEICHHDLPRLQTAMPSCITLNTDLQSPGPVVHGNSHQIQQVLNHLVTNGWEAIGNRTGQVTVATKTLPAYSIPKTHVSPTDWHAKTESYGVLEVTDTGCGMTEKAIEKIFDPFFSTKFTGRGLGLAVVTGLVKAWGGMIGVESTVGEGSTFRVFLPLIEDVVPLQFGMPTDPWNLEVGGSILLVESETMVRKTAEDMLKRLGFKVFAAANGNEAITLFEQHRDNIRCILTDLSMPGMDGLETLAALRQIQPGIPAILASGFDEFKAMNGNYAALPQAFLHKPYEMEDLKNALSRVLRDQAKNATRRRCYEMQTGKKTIA